MMHLSQSYQAFVGEPQPSMAAMVQLPATFPRGHELGKQVLYPSIRFMKESIVSDRLSRGYLK